MIINIDLDSWEVGYADGHFGRLSQCPANLDSLSYSSGYYEGRACHAGTDRNQSARRRASAALLIRRLDKAKKYVPVLYERDGPTTGLFGRRSDTRTL
jgi:hypothetical protein